MTSAEYSEVVLIRVAKQIVIEFGSDLVAGATISKECFEAGCKRFQDELFGSADGGDSQKGLVGSEIKHQRELT